MKNLLVAILIGVVLLGVFFLLGGMLSGGGHSLTAITVFFPYGLIAGRFLKDGHWDFISAVLIALQFPLYLIVLASLPGRRRKRLALVVILVIHFVAAVIGLKVYEQSKPR